VTRVTEKTLDDLVDYANLKQNDYRGVSNILQHDKASKMWDESTKEEKRKLIRLVVKGRKEEIWEWIRKHRAWGIEELPKSELIILAQKYHIKNYSRLMKHELIKEIKRCEKKN